MHVPLSWLREFTPIATDARDRAAVRELGDALDSLGLVVAGVGFVGGDLDGVVLARVREIHAIPGADRIRQVVVDAGGTDPVEIVCGAWNFVEGDVVPLAPVGTTLPNGMVIARRKMRGAVSEGMLCSGRELGLSDDAAGLMVLASPGGAATPLPGAMELGQPLAEYLGIVPDAVFDLEIEPNRPDCLSVAGVARDLAARLRLPFAIPEPVVHQSGRPVGELATVAVAAPEACQQLVGRVLVGVAPMASPPEIARRLVLAGMRPIGAVVDATNYVMLELGQPTHPYDLDRLGGHGIVVRLARPGERIITLDGVERSLGIARDAAGREVEVEDCLICDANDAPVGVAGVMGGASSEIGPSTTRVLLEAAEFAPRLVGGTSKRLGLRSEASQRFERGVDPEGVVRAADRVCELVALAAGSAGASAPAVAPGVVEDRPLRRERARVHVRTARVNALLGTKLATPEIAAYLAPIGFVSAPEGDGLLVEVPSFRPDTTREVDVIEEVARHHGYGNITATRRRSPYVGRRSRYQLARRVLRQLIAGTGAHEAWTSSIVDPAEERRAASGAEPVVLANPMVQEESALRTHLLPGLLGALRHNSAHRNGSVRLFELGAVFRPAAGREPDERELLGVLLAGDGDDAEAAVACWWRLADGLGLERDALELRQRGPGETAPLDHPLALGCHPTRSALIVARQADADQASGGGDTVVGVVGEVDPRVLDAFELRGRRVGWLACDLERLLAVPARASLASPVSRYPSSDIDLAFALAEHLPAAALATALRRAAGELLESVRLIDVYRGPGLAEGTRSLAYRLRFCAPDRTLTDAEVAGLRAACIAAAGAELGALLRA
ncbi:MAG TPA: phenylalanine--tRNA ligase subunit beta [Acidimicrobiales bacterium]|nr:phenylalanine--tRNA ligase subunit beta [Acidimicrobiales bacterium]